MGKRTSCWVLVGFLAGLVTVGGCGQRTLPVKQTQAFEGKLVHNGEPLRFVLVTLTPVKPEEGAEAHGRTDEKGVFTPRTYSNNEPDGIVPGEYKVTIEQFNPVEGGALPPGAEPTKVTPELANAEAIVTIAEGESEATITIP
jgi:hypothetical protein